LISVCDTDNGKARIPLGTTQQATTCPVVSCRVEARRMSIAYAHRHIVIFLRKLPIW